MGPTAILLHPAAWDSSSRWKSQAARYPEAVAESHLHQHSASLSSITWRQLAFVEFLLVLATTGKPWLHLGALAQQICYLQTPEMASHRRGLGCFSPLAGWLGVAALAWATRSRSLSFTLSGTFGPVLCPRHGGVARHAEDPFAQRGGISAADLRDRRPEEESFVPYREPRQRSGQRPGFKESSALSRGGPRRTFKARAEEEEEPANLTKEEREQRFREQIKSPVTLTTFIKRTGSPEEFMWVMWTAMDETMLLHLMCITSLLSSMHNVGDRFRRSMNSILRRTNRFSSLPMSHCASTLSHPKM